MSELLTLAVLLGGLGLIVTSWQKAQVRRLARDRLAAVEDPETRATAPPHAVRPFARAHRVLPWVAAVIMAAVVYFWLQWGSVFAVALGLITGLLGQQLDAFLQGRAIERIELQLADALDLMVAALRAGAGILAALESAVHETRAPLRPQLEDLLGRIRYGDDPQAALRALRTQVPLETFRLFTETLAVHWEVGGSLAPTLATVGRVVRERIELGRRVRSITIEARFSVAVVLLLTYFLGLLFWWNNPERVEGFLKTEIGQYAAAGMALNQALGVVWVARISRIRY